MIETIDSSCKKVSETVPEVLIWFPDKDDRKNWDNFVENGRGNAFTVGDGFEKVLFKITEDDNECHVSDNYASKIVFLPHTGLSDKIFGQIKIDFALRIFRNEEFDILISQKLSPVEDIWNQISKRIERRPLFLIDEDKNTETFSSWLLKIKDVVIDQNKKKYSSDETNFILSNIENILQYKKNHKLLHNQKRINSIDDLKYILYVHQNGKNYLDKIDKNKKNQETFIEKIFQSKADIDKICIKNYEKTRSLATKSSFSWNISEDLAPGIKKLIENTKCFEQKLISENKNNELVIIAENLNGHLTLKPPALAFLGSFSSGKTTLLNALLFSGLEDWKNFRTSTVANTAIISEITYAEDDQKEEALFSFHERIDHIILSASNNSDYELTRDENIGCLIGLIEKKILNNLNLIVTYENKKIEKINNNKAIIIFLKSISRDRILKRMERVEFNADVDQDRIKSINIPQKIDLSTKEGWLQLNPSENNALYLENELAPFLIKKAEIKLNNPLLRLTTIADTPGTGSWNDRHDIVTERYINLAENYILLLPTKTAQATRVKKIIDQIAEEARKKDKMSGVSPLSTIAFVVNCFTTHDVSDRKKRAKEFENYIKESFGLLNQEWEREKNKCFFAVNLKDICKGANTNELYGYNSIVQLREWIEKSFSRGAYRIRLEKILGILKNDWRKMISSLEESKRELESDRSQKNKIIKEINKFKENEITFKKEEALANFKKYINSIKDIKARMTKRLNEFVNHPKEKEDIRYCHQYLLHCYSDIDDVFKDIRGEDPLGEWINWIKEELGKLNIIPPSIAPVTCNGWSPKLSLSQESLNQRVKKIEEKWPSNIIDKGWQWLKDKTFGNDKRKVMAEELKEYCKAQYDSIETPLMKYVALCCSFIENNSKEVTTRCKKTIEELESDEDKKEKIKEKNSILALFNKYNSERNSLIKAIENEIGLTE